MAKIYGSSTFRILGTAAAAQNLFTIENGSTKIVVIRELTIQSDQTAALTGVSPLVKATRLAAFPTGGTVLVKVPFNLGNPSESTIILRGANASDGGVASAITATPADTIYQQYLLRNHTLVGQVVMPTMPLLPKLNFKQGEELDVTLGYNQALLVHLLASAAGSNPATNFYVINCIWEEI